MKRAMFFATMIASTLATAVDAEPVGQAADEAAVREAVKSYVAAFNQSDAKALAAMWSPAAVYTNPISGEKVVGRDSIEKQFAGIFAESKGVKLAATTNSVQFISPNVAIEHGTAQVIRSDQEPEESQYTAVYVKRDGQWLLDRVTEEDEPVVSSQYEQLKELEWLIGKWVNKDAQNRVETTYQWTKNQNFITCFFTASVEDRIDMTGMQIIGWDPAAKQIRSWVFDSGGGFGQGVWSKKDNRWSVQTIGTLPDGNKASAVNIITFVDGEAYTWQSINRVAGGELLPNVDEVVVNRQPAE